MASPQLFPRMFGTILPAMLSFALSARLLRGRARMDEIQTITRGAAHNPTTEMDLALWALCTEVRSDPDSLSALLTSSTTDASSSCTPDRFTLSDVP